MPRIVACDRIPSQAVGCGSAGVREYGSGLLATGPAPVVQRLLHYGSNDQIPMTNDQKDERDLRDLPLLQFCVLHSRFCILRSSPTRPLAPSQTPATSAEAVKPPGQARAGRLLPHAPFMPSTQPSLVGPVPAAPELGRPLLAKQNSAVRCQTSGVSCVRVGLGITTLTPFRS
jgi:hypothetical protein